MAILDLSVRYFQDATPEGVACREENFVRRKVEMGLPLGQTALVLVDVWDNHFIESWLERATRITEEGVVPVLAKAREVGMTVVHAPSPPIAEQYGQLKQHKEAPPSVAADWPPAEFRARAGAYAEFRGPRAQPPGIPGIPELGMSPLVEVGEEEYVVATGEQLHALAEEEGILHLIYAGFATNWCILNRDYGMRAMARRGYNMILLRDATAGVEFPDTVDVGFATEMAVREVEQQLGFTASNADFFAACDGALKS
jgi:nicotinamidase-related amidase